MVHSPPIMGRRMPSQAPEVDPTDVRGLLHEYSMLVQTGLLIADVALEKNHLVQNALLESCLVHARNLHDFLGPPPRNPRPGDYFASDFVEGFKVEVFDRVTVNKINRWLHHLTTYRYRDDDHPSWQVNEDIVCPIVGAMDRFLDSLDTDIAAPLNPPHRAGRKLCATIRRHRRGIPFVRD